MDSREEKDVYKVKLRPLQVIRTEDGSSDCRRLIESSHDGGDNSSHDVFHHITKKKKKSLGHVNKVKDVILITGGFAAFP